MTIAPFTETPSRSSSLVVLGQAVVHVDEGAGDVAVDRVGVVGRELLVLLAAGRVHGEGRLVELAANRVGAIISRSRSFGVGKSTSKRLDPRVPAPLAEAGQDPLGVLLAVGRADVVRARAQPAHRLAHVVGAGDGEKAGLPLVPGAGRSRLARDGGEEGEQGKTDGDEQQLALALLTGMFFFFFFCVCMYSFSYMCSFEHCDGFKTGGHTGAKDRTHRRTSRTSSSTWLTATGWWAGFPSRTSC